MFRATQLAGVLPSVLNLGTGLAVGLEKAIFTKAGGKIAIDLAEKTVTKVG